MEGRAAGQTGGGSLFPNTSRLPACTKAELQKQDRGSRQGMAMLGTDQLNHRVRSSNSSYGGKDEVTWGLEQERNGIQGFFAPIKEACEDRKEWDGAQSSDRTPCQALDACATCMG